MLCLASFGKAACDLEGCQILASPPHETRWCAARGFRIEVFLLSTRYGKLGCPVPDRGEDGERSLLESSGKIPHFALQKGDLEGLSRGTWRLPRNNHKHSNTKQARGKNIIRGCGTSSFNDLWMKKGGFPCLKNWNLPTRHLYTCLFVSIICILQSYAVITHCIVLQFLYIYIYACVHCALEFKAYESWNWQQMSNI